MKELMAGDRELTAFCKAATSNVAIRVIIVLAHSIHFCHTILQQLDIYHENTITRSSLQALTSIVCIQQVLRHQRCSPTCAACIHEFIALPDVTS
jgi:hypothetical protein